MTDTTTHPSANDIIVSIKVRLGELDFEIFDANNKVKNSQKLLDKHGPEKFMLEYQTHNSYQEGVLKTLEKEKQTLEKIMRGEYGRENKK